jgi:ketosteroid isomerase-like protein
MPNSLNLVNESSLVERTLEHFDAVRRKDLESILALYEQTEDLLVFVEGPRWQTLGFENVKRGWKDFVDSPIDMIGCKWAEHLRFGVTAEMGFVAGVAELDLNINGDRKIILFRGSFIFQKNDHGHWKVVFEHFSQPATDPYGIGDWLKPL